MGDDAEDPRAHVDDKHASVVLSATVGPMAEMLPPYSATYYLKQTQGWKNPFTGVIFFSAVLFPFTCHTGTTP
jgi:hypothetical protein